MAFSLNQIILIWFLSTTKCITVFCLIKLPDTVIMRSRNMKMGPFHISIYLSHASHIPNDEIAGWVKDLELMNSSNRMSVHRLALKAFHTEQYRALPFYVTLLDLCFVMSPPINFNRKLLRCSRWYLTGTPNTSLHKNRERIKTSHL